jgi:hypothetical protein
LQQTKAEPELVNAIKNYTKVHDEILQEVYAKAIKEFIDSFKNIAPGEHHPIFYASPSAVKTHSPIGVIWFQYHVFVNKNIHCKSRGYCYCWLPI